MSSFFRLSVWDSYDFAGLFSRRWHEGLGQKIQNHSQRRCSGIPYFFRDKRTGRHYFLCTSEIFWLIRFYLSATADGFVPPFGDKKMAAHFFFAPPPFWNAFLSLNFRILLWTEFVKSTPLLFRKTQNTQHKQKKLVKTAKIFHVVKLATCFLVFSRQVAMRVW